MRLIIAALVIAFMSSCNASKKGNNSNNTQFTPSFAPGPPTIVYKTKNDLSDKVPVILNEEKTKIISYPSQDDLKIGEKLRTPISLSKGWLLDEKGINLNVAFLDLTYAQYSAMDSIPDLDSLFEMIIDANPIEAMCNCGNRNSIPNAIEQLNELIESNELEKVCKVIK